MLSKSSLYDLYDRLDRLEELLEDMAELGVASVGEVEAAIKVLNDEIDRLESESDEDSER